MWKLVIFIQCIYLLFLAVQIRISSVVLYLLHLILDLLLRLTMTTTTEMLEILSYLTFIHPQSETFIIEIIL